MKIKKTLLRIISVLILLSTFNQGQSLKESYNNNKLPKLELVWEFSETNEVILQNPENINIDSYGNVYFLDEKASCVKKLSPDGKFLKQVGQKGKGPGEFTRINGFSFDENNNYYLYDFMINRLSIFDESDKFVKSLITDNRYRNLLKLGKNYVARKTDLKNFERIPENKLSFIVFNSDLKLPHKIDSVFSRPSILKKTDNSLFIMEIHYGSEIYSLINSKNELCVLNSEDYNIKIYSKSGELKENWKIGKKRNRVSAREKEKLQKQQAERYQDKNHPFSDMLEISEYKPHFKYVLTDENYFLLRSYDDEDKGLFDIISPAGKLIRQIELPEEIFNDSAVIKNGFVYTVSTNEDELPVIRKYKIN